MADGGSVVVYARGDVDQDTSGLLNDSPKVSGFAVPAEQLKTSLEDFVKSLKTILPPEEGDGAVPGLKLDEITVAVAVNGKGQVGFLGVGGEVGGEATLTLTFSRK